MSTNASTASTYDCIQFRAMNSDIVVKVKKGSCTYRWQEDIIHWFSHFETTCSRFQSSSFLSQFNQMQIGNLIIVPELFYEVMYEAWELAKKTDFYFHPFVGDALEAIGYSRSFSHDFSCGDGDEVRGLEWTPIHSSYLHFHPHMKAIEKKTSRQIDLGGIGKGWCVEQAALWLKNQLGVSSGLVDGAGDMYCWSEEKDPWIIGIEDPCNQDNELLALRISLGAVATSNTQYRRWQQGDKQRHHIINGKTGLPADSDIIQATVVGPSTSEAEVVAKVICMLPNVDVAEWIERYFPHLGYVIVLNDGKVEISKNLTKRVVSRRV